MFLLIPETWELANMQTQSATQHLCCKNMSVRQEGKRTKKTAKINHEPVYELANNCVK